LYPSFCVTPILTKYGVLIECRFFLESENLKGRDYLEDGWEDNIKMDFKELALEGFDWIQPANDRAPASSCKHGNEPSSSIKDE
jgi:hypothetical protein